eukprot:543708_1
MSIGLYQILLYVIIGAFIALLIISFEQCCMVYALDGKKLKVSLLIIVYCIICFIGNCTNYLYAMYPDESVILGSVPITLLNITSFIEAIYEMLGFHIYRIFTLSIIARLYIPTKDQPPKSYETFFNILVMFMCSMIIIFYSLIFIYNDQNWKYILYLILDVVILIWAILIAFRMNELLKILHAAQQNVETKRATTASRIAWFTAISVCIAAVIDIIWSLATMTKFDDLKSIGKHEPWNNFIIHSIFNFVLVLGVIVMNYQKNICCRISEYSVCAVYGCYHTTVCCCCKVQGWNIQTYAGYTNETPILTNDNTSFPLKKSTSRQYGFITPLNQPTDPINIQ